MGIVNRWFLGLSQREKVLCFLSVFIIIIFIGFYFIEAMVKEKRWYQNKMDNHKSVDVSIVQSGIEGSKGLSETYIFSAIKSTGEALQYIYETAQPLNSLSIIDVEINQHLINAKVNDFVIDEYHVFLTIEGDKKEIVKYIHTINKEYKQFYWEGVHYYSVDGKYFVKFNFKLYAKKGLEHDGR